MLPDSENKASFNHSSCQEGTEETCMTHTLASAEKAVIAFTAIEHVLNRSTGPNPTSLAILGEALKNELTCQTPLIQCLRTWVLTVSVGQYDLQLRGNTQPFSNPSRQNGTSRGCTKIFPPNNYGLIMLKYGQPFSQDESR